MNIKKSLIGSEEERAVSPVIGVILMVAITVILAAVIAAFVLDLGGSVGEEAQAGVDLEVDETDYTVQMSATSMGNADRIELRSDVTPDADVLTAEQSGDVITLDYSEQEYHEDGYTFEVGDDPEEDDPDGADSYEDGGVVFNGTVTAVAIIDGDDTETTVTSEDFDFYEDFVEEKD
ncbi:DUF1628 domain protein [Natrialba magadii ATCC 43099]|uniref:DUF1628 domain protein n=1 Tax=Natrialba magadii (strain ATCC 43099 / DSM 3394 / CCM 3739 / CIP 104546 / IAM 13178 / JCM 8861 / NBRC 102185 / NCIMB 2190 / MS3) TaxID=547559 RepID=D3SX63_NATMM|nr:type IV pilin N-terminal domain-containing protein [Natrialba magadii]ADD03883.1 DUF1628 domain protein [Natrialba magadii ATCC 43099]ELY33542.1 hypothetical protein C500_01880 [Natrialba magadii ATCC 43099]